MSPIFQDSSIGVGLLLALLVALELGFRFGVRTVVEGDTRAAPQVGAIQGALLGLLGLLLAFSFAAAGARFLERQDLIVQEANAIGTATLRADLLPPPHRDALRTALKNYTEHRLAATSRIRLGLTPQDSADVDRLQSSIWAAAIQGVHAKPDVMLGVLPPVNEVIDLHSTRIAAGKKHVPPVVLWLLITCSVLSVAVIGFGCGLSGRRRLPLTFPLAIVIAASLWITMDLDQPRAGMLQLNDEPLKSLKFD